MIAAFILASLVLAATPGPGVLYVVTRTLSQGRTAGLASVAGVALGNLVNALVASLGLAAVLAVSSLAFQVVKFGGAAYLIYLGVRTLMSPAEGGTVMGQEPVRVQVSRLFRDGFWVAVLNPKTALFFAAFLPQFMDPARTGIGQSLDYGAAFVAIAAMTDSLYVMAAQVLSPLLAGLSKGTHGLRLVSASVYLGLGLLTALSGGRNGT